MCGIFGFAGEGSGPGGAGPSGAFRVAGLLQALALSDQVRGKHSTGIAVVAQNPKSMRPRPLVVKKALSGTEFVREGHTRLLFQEKFHLAIGHNRFATSGPINDRNAHPFPIPTSRGVAFAAHNGCVGGKTALAQHFGVKDFDVDSEVFFRAIGRHAGRTEKDLLDSIEVVVCFVQVRADFASVWLDVGFSPPALYLFRSPERPLAVFDARKVGLGRWFASTIDIFSSAWGSVRGYLPPIRKVSYFEPKPYSIYRVVDDGRWEIERVRDIAVERRSLPSSDGFLSSSQPSWRHQSRLWDQTDPDLRRHSPEGEGEEEGLRYFVCTACKDSVETESAVFRDRATGRQSSSGAPYHEACLVG